MNLRVFYLTRRGLSDGYGEIQTYKRIALFILDKRGYLLWPG